MKVLGFGEKCNTPVAVALGFFDCVHKGHAAVIARAKELAGSMGAECAVFTFRNDPGTYFGKQKRLYTFEERLEALSDIGVERVIAADFDAAFASLSAEEFLQKLTSSLPVVAVTAGEDHTYGRGAEGNADALKKALSPRVKTEILPILTSNGEKISSTAIKSAIERGDVARANAMLSEPYFMLGKVAHAHGRGNSFGFPTANIPYDESRLAPAAGVYATTVTVDGVTMAGGTNVGTKPTFGDDRPSVETFILDFEGDIYGKDIKLSFHEKIRDICRFPSAEALAAALKKDVARIREILGRQK